MRLTARRHGPAASPEDGHVPWSAERWSPPSGYTLTVDARLHTAAELTVEAVGEPAASAHAA